MTVAVWDTYVKKKDGSIMHFDILVPKEQKDEAVIFSFGKTYLASKGQEGAVLNASECSFCHMEDATPNVAKDIAHKGFSIIEMEGCNA